LTNESPTTVDMEQLGLDSRRQRTVLDVKRSDDVNIHPHDLYISMLAQQLPRWERPDWLDIGCGWHLDWPWRAKQEETLLSAANVIGIDPDWQAISRHRTITKRIVGHVETLPFDNDSFDLVTANVVVEHLKYPALAFAEIFRVLRPGGIFVFRTPSARSYSVAISRRLPQRLKVWLATSVIEKRKEEDVYPAHYRANTPEVIGEICEVAGFRRVDVTITKPRGVLSRFPVLVGAERLAISTLGFKDGNLIVEAEK
jgi:ubiquinone/menaquinone biosynthesis C-methylase UbiE